MRDRRRYLDFELPLAEFDEQIQKMRDLKISEGVDLSAEIRRLEDKSKEILQKLSQDLTSYQKVQLSRHPDRPNFSDYVNLVFDKFSELKGDRAFRDDGAIAGGLAELGGETVMLIGHQKGKSTQENVERNFGMPRPEGYRKALRLMKLAEQWNLPIVTLVDTPGAYPGLDAEERGQSEAIARNIIEMSGLKVPIVTVVIGEGGSGGALAIAVCDRLLMFEYAIYSVISPEGCAAITWKDGAFTAQAAEALQLTAKKIFEFGIADELIKEPLGGAHREPASAAFELKQSLLKHLTALKEKPSDLLLRARYQKYRDLGPLAEAEKKWAGAQGA
jgi:acetyl-CoA carboxylase carboxyl transferase subunit alpha